MLAHTYFVYIMTNLRRHPFYVGLSGYPDRRATQHKREVFAGFTAKYKLHRLVYFEEFGDIRAAIAREKQLKGWSRAKKIVLIESMNPDWSDLSRPWIPRGASTPSSTLRVVSVAQHDTEVRQDGERRQAFIKQRMRELRHKASAGGNG